MGLTQRQGPYTEKSFCRSAALYSIEFTAHESATALVYQDEGGVSPAGAASVSRSADGVYTVTFPNQNLKVIPVGVVIEKDGDWTATVTAVTEGATTNSLVVRTYAAGTLDDPDASVFLTVRFISSHGS